eukprot:1815424-Heterocapsa_arctica.AAC.1
MFAGDSVGVPAVAASASRSAGATPRARVRDPVRRPDVLDIDVNAEEHCPLPERPGEDAAGEKIKSQKQLKEEDKSNNVEKDNDEENDEA